MKKIIENLALIVLWPAAWTGWTGWTGATGWTGELPGLRQAQLPGPPYQLFDVLCQDLHF